MMTNLINNTNTGNPEWYTPAHIINAARKTMGSIDCDPASNATAQQNIKAKVYYTRATNGIDKDWYRTVWLNPPYYTGSKKNPGINVFASKLLEQIANGHTTQAIFLAQAKTDTKWFQRLKNNADAVMFTKGRIKFVDANGKEGGNPSHGSVLFYFGNNHAEFVKNFNDIAYEI